MTNFSCQLSRPSFPRFPSLFGDHFLESFFDEGNKIVGSSKQMFSKAQYPYNLYTMKDGTTIIEFALAGFDKSEVSIEVVDERLQIKASKNVEKVEHNEENEDERLYYMNQIAARDLDYSFQIAQVCDVDNIKSEFVNGLLKLTIPTKAEARKKIEIS